jgi:hypothetical protein
MYDEKLREEKIALSELKERISQFLYQHFIDFERDRSVMIQDKILRPAFVIPKHEIVIDCFQLAEAENPDFAEKATTYLSDGVKFLPIDLRVLASKNVEAALREQLPKLGCSL